MAERLLAHALKNEDDPLNALKVDSAGAAAYTGDPASPNAVNALEKVGIPLDDHRSKPVTEELMNDAVAVFCMTEGHREIIRGRFQGVPEHLYLMREFLPEEQGREIPDPFGADLSSYEACRDSMVEAIPPIIRFLRRAI